jgi:PAS domain S-box-containing protein
MAEAFARVLAPAGVRIASASAGVSAAPRVHPLAVQVMREAGLDISNAAAKNLHDLDNTYFELVITLCEQAAEQCPELPGAPARVAWNLPDPQSGQLSEEELLAAFRAMRDKIRQLVEDLFQRGYFNTFAAQKRNFDAVLDNLTDGILVHDLSRRILHFNKAAEAITGHRATDIMGRDCHEVFPNGFCGGKCSFQDGACTPGFDQLKYAMDIFDVSGTRKHLEMSVIPMMDDTGAARGVIASFRDITHVLDLEERLNEVRDFSNIIGRDHRMQHVFKLIRDVAPTDVPVLVLGETGTGKELVAAAVHAESQRAGNLFVPVNCGALPEGIIESELFGHVKGAFTGAVRDKKGRFEMAHGGTIFLDEIGDLPLSLQVKLLRVLQEGTFERVGGEETIKVNVRVISATNQDLRRLMSQGRFREDLYYRLNVAPVQLPPLRERRNDIPLLAQHFLKKIALDMDRPEPVMSRECMNVLLDFDWPGNVRQLQNAIQFAMMKCKDKDLEPYHLPPEIYKRPEMDARGKPGRKPKLDADSVRLALERAGGNKAKAARMLGIGRATLYRYFDNKNS